ncbi:MAG: STAS domain-containing protein [Lachnospiraceae bacterium]|nr:STAS domain-containing protein [Lachnospiraceae bacterium]
MDDELLSRVNPVYKHEQSCIMNLARAGVENAQKVLEALEYDKLTDVDPQFNDMEIVELVNRALCIADEAKYLMTNDMIRGYEFNNIVDMPCGYSPRGLLMSNEGYKYVGLDFPIVISDILPVIKGLCSKNAHRISYEAMDATNFGSLSHALENVTGEISIVSELFLSYLTENELISVCDNIYKILASRGGCWITFDIGCGNIYRNTLNALGGKAYSNTLDSIVLNSIEGLDLFNNSLFKKGREGAEDFLKFRGFDIEKISVNEVFPELKSTGNDSELTEKLEEAYDDMEYWTLTVNKRRGSRVINTQSQQCTIDKKLGNGFLYLSISGRIDTITAPNLLEVYEEALSQGELEKITIDCKNLDYISSAGLRVILMMVKNLKNASGMTLKNVSPAVMDILDTAGFCDKIENITSA